MYVLTADYTSPTAAEDFTTSLKKTGFGVLKNHPVPYALIQEVYKEWDNFFSSQDKFNHLFNPDDTCQAGYFPFKSENAKGYDAKNLMEFYHYYRKNSLPAGLSEKTTQLWEKLFAIAQEVLGWLQESLPEDVAASLSTPLTEMVKTKDTTLMRVIHYPAVAEGEDPASVRSAAHEDIDLLTVLVAATTPGLQVKDVHGKWHEVTCEPGNLVFNAGDMLQMATKGYYKSTTHQVVRPEGDVPNVPRYSVPMFVHPCNEVVLSETHTAGSYLRQRLYENGLRKNAAA